METMARIGSSIQIKGEVTSREPLTISGLVDGTVMVDGHELTVEDGAKVTASLMADTIIVAGRVNGRLDASVRIVVRTTATIDGDLSAPTVALADGATLNGHVETALRKASLSLAS
jgi:cytoskeletal protein CcmA (bactofilin family)